MTPTLDELTARIESMAPAARAKLLAEVGKSMARHIWMPLPGPQTMAYKSQADVVGYGGSAGGGKSDLAIGKALMRHHEVLIIRPASLAIRLWANMVAGHLLLVTFAVLSAALWDSTKVGAVLPFAVLILMTGFEILVSFLQAFIFTILTAVYINMASHAEH